MAYMPAYLRRYPVHPSASCSPTATNCRLCFDPTSGAFGEDEDGEPLFDGDGQPTELTKNILQFCEQFESAGLRTQAFMTELKNSGLLMEGEVSIQPDGVEQPFLYRGFRMIDEEKLRELRGDELRKMNQSGMLPLIYAHLMSLALIRDVFFRQASQGKGPMGAADDGRPDCRPTPRPTPKREMFAPDDRRGGLKRRLRRPIYGAGWRGRFPPLAAHRLRALRGAFLPELGPPGDKPGRPFFNSAAFFGREGAHLLAR